MKNIRISLAAAGLLLAFSDQAALSQNLPGVDYDQIKTPLNTLSQNDNVYQQVVGFGAFNFGTISDTVILRKGNNLIAQSHSSSGPHDRKVFIERDLGTVASIFGSNDYEIGGIHDRAVPQDWVEDTMTGYNKATQNFKFVEFKVANDNWVVEASQSRTLANACSNIDASRLEMIGTGDYDVGVFRNDILLLDPITEVLVRVPGPVGAVGCTQLPSGSTQNKDFFSTVPDLSGDGVDDVLVGTVSPSASDGSTYDVDVLFLNETFTYSGVTSGSFANTEGRPSVGKEVSVAVNRNGRVIFSRLLGNGSDQFMAYIGRDLGPEGDQDPSTDALVFKEQFEYPAGLPTPAGSSDPAVTGDIDTPEFRITDDWVGGFTGYIDFVYRGSTTTDGDWTLTFDTTFEILELWDGVVTSVDNGDGTYSHTVDNGPFNGTVDPGDTISIGFNANDTPTSQLPLVSVPISNVTTSVVEDWGTGFTGNLSFTYSGSLPVNSWQLEFDTDDFVVFESWDSVYVGQSGSTFTFGNETFNNLVNPTETITIGFNADGDPAGTISNVELAGTIDNPVEQAPSNYNFVH